MKKNQQSPYPDDFLLGFSGEIPQGAVDEIADMMEAPGDLIQDRPATPEFVMEAMPPMTKLIAKASKKRKRQWVRKSDVRKEMPDHVTDDQFDEYWNARRKSNLHHRNYEFGSEGDDETVTLGKRAYKRVMSNQNEDNRGVDEILSELDDVPEFNSEQTIFDNPAINESFFAGLSDPLDEAAFLHPDDLEPHSTTSMSALIGGAMQFDQIDEGTANEGVGEQAADEDLNEESTLPKGLNEDNTEAIKEFKTRYEPDMRKAMVALKKMNLDTEDYVSAGITGSQKNNYPYLEIKVTFTLITGSTRTPKEIRVKLYDDGDGLKIRKEGFDSYSRRYQSQGAIPVKGDVVKTITKSFDWVKKERLDRLREDIDEANDKTVDDLMKKVPSGVSSNIKKALKILLDHRIYPGEKEKAYTVTNMAKIIYKEGKLSLTDEEWYELRNEYIRATNGLPGSWFTKRLREDHLDEAGAKTHTVQKMDLDGWEMKDEKDVPKKVVDKIRAKVSSLKEEASLDLSDEGRLDEKIEDSPVSDNGKKQIQSEETNLTDRQQRIEENFELNKDTDRARGMRTRMLGTKKKFSDYL